MYNRPLTVLASAAEELAFLQAIVENPNNVATYSALTDWLEDHDQRRAELFLLHRRLLASCCQPEQNPERAGWQAQVVKLLSEGVRPCVPQQAVKLPEGIEMVFS